MTYKEKLEEPYKVVEEKKKIHAELSQIIMKGPIDLSHVEEFEKANNDLREAIGNYGRHVYRMGIEYRKPEDIYQEN